MAEERKKALVEKLDHQRSQIVDHCQSLRCKVSPSYQIRKSIQKHPGRWAATSAATAFLLVRLIRSKGAAHDRTPKKRGLLLRTGKLAFKLARPSLTAFALKQAQEYAEGKFGHHPDNSMLGGPPQK